VRHWELFKDILAVWWVKGVVALLLVTTRCTLTVHFIFRSIHARVFTTGCALTKCKSISNIALVLLLPDVLDMPWQSAKVKVTLVLRLLLPDVLDTVTVTLFFSHNMLPFHSITLPCHFPNYSLTSFSLHCFLMLPLSLTRLDSLSHEPSFPVLLPLVRAPSLYLFKSVVTGCISLTWIYLVLSDNLNSSSLGRRLALLTSNKL